MLKAITDLRRLQAGLHQAAVQAKSWAASLQAQTAQTQPGLSECQSMCFRVLASGCCTVHCGVTKAKEELSESGLIW